MFNLLVKSKAWASGRDTIPIGRVFEYTDPRLVERFKAGGQLDLQAISTLPTVFMEETSRQQQGQVARVGTITRARLSGSDVALEYTYDPAVPLLPNFLLEDFASDLDIEVREFSRTHWSVKDVDLFRAILRLSLPRRPQSKVFRLNEPEHLERDLVSVMMPFERRFDAVYSCLQTTARSAGFRCQRADDIWINPEVVQDVVSLIDRSSIVLCDCTGRNPNVFYETGIAHTLGREVILITQIAADIPFDLRHLRYVEYLSNGEGLNQLASRLHSRLTDLAQQVSGGMRVSPE